MAKRVRRRSRALVIMLLPVLVFLGVMGWLACALEPNSKPSPKTRHQERKPKGDDGVTFMPAVFEDRDEVIRHCH